ncbi:ArsR/SmtB family transcription factor [Actinoalloteichus hymeniacidonis]|uniref:Transcriptional regulator n=1 Tax=Actinoalloteichus hymeniacidonis TaxID=340345 RepID=A0AAC9MYC0_9PSEU|nr:metalloregulator ArsR/SmtB family transcription factor [Actinoalloteichus hymeniacidonis]AOS62822.1 putative transcriptional regulator [Actinoalloteichus hymeniacidonis]MBB5909147.1 DNA-binding transcriptional ArsR family regulator [Actinoalloteichus hymeniacidonis]
MSERDVLGALADPMRRRILEGIGAHGETTATMLAGGLPVSRQAVVQHLAVLERAGLVRGRKEGREVRFTVCPDALTDTADWLTGLADRWAGRLAAIKRIAEEDPDPDSGTRGAPRRRGSD